jgi:hypothetical protein
MSGFDVILLEAAYDSALRECEASILQNVPQAISDHHEYRRSFKQEMQGDLIYANFMKFIDNLPNGFKMGILQQEFIEEIVHTILPIIYWDDWDQHKEMILRKYGMDRHSYIVLCELARRFGKTETAISCFYAMLMAVPRASIAVYAQNMTMSMTIVRRVRNLVLSQKVKNFKVVEDNKHTFGIHIDGDAEPKYIYALSSKPQVIFVDVCVVPCVHLSSPSSAKGKQTRVARYEKGKP